MENQIKKTTRLVGLTILTLWMAMSTVAAAEPEMETLRMAVLDFGHDYARMQDNPEFGGGWKPDRRKLLTDIEVDGNLATKDCAYTTFFSLEKPFNSQDAFWNESHPCAVFYGGYSFAAANRSSIRPSEHYVNIGEGESHNKPNDNLALHMMSYQEDGPFTAHAAWIWKKENFLDSASHPDSRVWFDDDSLMALYSARYYGGWEGRRFVVSDQGQLYISETLAEAWDGESRTALYTLNPTKAKWAKWNPQEWSHDFSFNPEEAVFGPHDFKDVDRIGWYIYKDTLDTATVRMKWESFECFANVTKPKVASSLMNMSEVSGGGNSAFYVENTDLPYRTWHEVFRWAKNGQYALGPKPYNFERDGDMGSMDDGFSEHGADEPVTDLRIYDVLAWCNALSEREGREPCYYTDPEFKNVYRIVIWSPWFVRASELNEKPTIYVNWSADGFRLSAVSEWLEAKEKNIAHEQTTAVGTFPVTMAASDIRGMDCNARELVWSWGDSMPAEPNKLVALGGSYRDKTTPDAYYGAPDVGCRIVRREAGLPAPKLEVPLPGDAAVLPKDGKRKTVMTTEENLVACVEIPAGEFQRPGKEMLIQMDPFLMGKTEVSYHQWKTLYDWAVTHGYKFDRDGDMGSMDWKNKHFTHHPDEPVTGISVYDTFVWCNALSEYEGRVPVYYADHTLSNVLRVANSWRPTHMRLLEQKNKAHETRGLKFNSAAKFDGQENKELAPGRAVWLRWDVDGYRLPTKAESFYVACSGSSETYPWGNSFDQVGDFAWYLENSGERTHRVGTKKANAYGVYDIFGNAMEFFTDTGGAGQTCGHGGNKLYMVQKKNPVGVQPWEKGFLRTVNAMMVGFVHEEEEKFGVDNTASDRQIGSLDMGVPYGDLGFRIVRCEGKATPAGEVKYSYPREGRKHVEITDCEPPLDDWMKTHGEFDSLDGRCFRYNLSRNGIWPTKGLPKLNGEKWKFKTGGPVKSSPVVVNGKLYIGSEDNSFYCLDAETGALVWQVKTTAPILSSACVSKGVVYFGNDERMLYAVDANSGKEIWKVQAGKKGAIRNSPAVAWGIVFVGPGRKQAFGTVSMVAGTLLGFDIKSGKQVWKGFRQGPQGFGSAAIYDGKLIYGDCTMLNQVDLSSGMKVGWKPVGALAKTWGSPAVVGDDIYITGPLAGVFQMMKISKGKNVKKFDFEVLAWPEQVSFYVGGELSHEVFSSPTVAPDGTAYIACNDGNLYTFDTTTLIRDEDYKKKGIQANAPKRGWAFDMGAGTKSSPSYADGVVYVGADNGKLFAVDGKSGRKLWEFETGGPIISSPWPGNRVVYIGSDDGFVYALD